MFSNIIKERKYYEELKNKIGKKNNKRVLKKPPAKKAGGKS